MVGTMPLRATLSWSPLNYKGLFFLAHFTEVFQTGNSTVLLQTSDVGCHSAIGETIPSPRQNWARGVRLLLSNMTYLVAWLLLEYSWLLALVSDCSLCGHSRKACGFHIIVAIVAIISCQKSHFWKSKVSFLESKSLILEIKLISIGNQRFIREIKNHTKFWKSKISFQK